MVDLQQFIATNKKSIFSFLTVGAVTAVIYFSLFSLLWKQLDINYNIAISIAYITSTCIHFNANRYFSFKTQKAPVLHQLSRYLVMITINYIITLMIVNVTVEQFQLMPYVGVMLAVATTFGTGYLISRFWVFNIS